MKRDLGLVSIGDAVVALVAQGRLATAETYRRAQLGDALLAAVGASRLGVEVAFVTRVAEDAFGDWLIESWDAEGLHLDYARRVAGHNALMIVGRDGDAREALPFYDSAAVSGLDESDVAPVPWELARYCYAPGATQALSPSARGAVLRAFELAREHGAQVVYDPTLRPGLWPGEQLSLARAAMAEVLELVDVLVISAPLATGKLLGEPSAEPAAREARRRGVGRVIVREGSQGCVVADGRGLVRVPATSDETSGLVGTALGAVFNGALLGGLARGLAAVDATQLALDAVAWSAGKAAGLGAVPDLEELNDLRVAAGREAL